MSGSEAFVCTNPIAQSKARKKKREENHQAVPFEWCRVRGVFLYVLTCVAAHGKRQAVKRRDSFFACATIQRIGVGVKKLTAEDRMFAPRGAGRKD
ncbi:hypothetical protein BHE74_00021671 [Ensete ventricosum]|nr:hypothetical protein BHE74_00021671 [Ensete ventricosum]